MKQKTAILFMALAVAASTAGCQKKETNPETKQTEIVSETQKQTEKATEKATEAISEAVPTEVETEIVTEVQTEVQTETAPTEIYLETAAPVEELDTMATVYIGTAGNFQEYPLDVSGGAAPETFVQAIADLTGWDLTLADMITSGPGGMTVCFSSQSSLFTGPPETQKEEFHVYDTYQLASTILDSIQKTLQNYFVDTQQGGDPSSLPIYYCMEGDQPLTIPGIDVTIPLDAPYSGI